MLRKEQFRKPGNTLELPADSQSPAGEPSAGRFRTCRRCGTASEEGAFAAALGVCPGCGKHAPLGARERIGITADGGSFEEMDAGLASSDLLAFPGYGQKLREAQAASGEKEALVGGTARIGGQACMLFAMEHRFMMGSMGTVTGEKITRLFEAAAERSLPVVGFALSGGARMQEGTLSLMQMAKTSASVRRHSDGRNLFVSVLCDPTAGGVMASFAMLGDIVLAEPDALICFAGPRVIEQTIRQKLPAGFQRAEFLMGKGFVDAIVERRELRETLARLLALHKREDRHGCL